MKKKKKKKRNKRRKGKNIYIFDFLFICLFVYFLHLNIACFHSLFFLVKVLCNKIYHVTYHIDARLGTHENLRIVRIT